MTGNKLFTIATGLNGGVALDRDIFDSLLNMVKNTREMSRDWVVLRTEDTSKTFSSSDNYLSTKSLPDRFLRIYSKMDQYGTQNGVFIVTSAGEKVNLRPIKMEDRYDYRDTDGYYYIDLKNNAIGRTGTTEGTLHLFYLQGTEDITESTSWSSFPEFSHILLAVDVVILNKGIIDWDTVNQSQIPISRELVRTLESRLAMWDAMHQQSMLGV